MASDATNRKYAKELMKSYKDLYELKFGDAPKINSYRDLWGFLAMVEDMGKNRASDVVKHFVDIKGLSVSELFNNYRRYEKYLDEREEDAAKQAEIRRETEKRVARWEKMHEN